MRIFMGNSLAKGALLGGLSFYALSLHASDFFDTTGGTTNEDTSKFGGINIDEAIDQKTQDIIRRFKDGRKSSNKDTKSRYSQILEHHDEDFDGITDHDGASNALEGGMEKAALGKQRLSGDKRTKALDKAKGNAGNCKNGDNKNNGNLGCKNISAVLVDRGAAHGSDKESEHRVYELTDTALKNAKEAGRKYAERAIGVAGDWGSQAAPPNATKITGPDGTVTALNVTSGGKTSKVGIAPNLDLLKSEYSYLEQLKDFQTKLQWKAMRAARLAGAESDPAVIRQFSAILEKGVEDEKNLQEVSRVVLEIGTIGSLEVCPDGTERNLKDTKPCNGQDPVTLNQLRAQRNSSDARKKAEALWDKYRKEGAPKGAQGKKQDQQNIAQVRQCMNRDTWCLGYSGIGRVMAQQIKAGKNSAKAPEAFKPISGDPGAAFADTREYNMNRLDAANSGGLDNFMNVLRSGDFNERTDGKTKSHPFAQAKAEWEAAKRAADIVKGKTQDAVRTRAFQNARYRQNNPYQGSQFNTSQMNTARLFGRNAQRDGSTLLTRPMPPGQRGPVSGGQSYLPPRQPSGYAPPGSDRSGVSPQFQ